MSEENLVDIVVKKALEKFQNGKNEWDEERYSIVLDLLESWTNSPRVFEVYTDDVGYDKSTRSRATNSRPDFWGLTTLSEWMESSTGCDKPTFISGMGMMAETWEEKIKEELEEMVDDFTYEVLGDLLEEDDQDTVPDVRIALEDNDRTAIGSLGVEGCYSGEGFIDDIGSMDPYEFASSVPSGILVNYPFLNTFYQKHLLNESLQDKMLEKSNDPVIKSKI